jgi:hypothetical protein
LHQRRQPTTPAIYIHRITVSSKPEVLQSVKACHTVSGLDEIDSATNQVGPHKRQTAHSAIQLTNIDDFNISKDQDMRNKTINARSDVDKPFWRQRVNLARGPQVLVEIVAAGNTALHVPIGQYGHQV